MRLRLPPATKVRFLKMLEGTHYSVFFFFYSFFNISEDINDGECVAAMSVYLSEILPLSCSWPSHHM